MLFVCGFLWDDRENKLGGCVRDLRENESEGGMMCRGKQSLREIGWLWFYGKIPGYRECTSFIALS